LSRKIILVPPPITESQEVKGHTESKTVKSHQEEVIIDKGEYHQIDGFSSRFNRIQKINNRGGETDYVKT